MVLCVFRLPISIMMIVGIHVLYLMIIIKSEVWPICHYLGLGHENNRMRRMFFIFLYRVSSLDTHLIGPGLILVPIVQKM